jgi:hypothetical protein
MLWLHSSAFPRGRHCKISTTRVAHPHRRTTRVSWIHLRWGLGGLGTCRKAAMWASVGVPPPRALAGGGLVLAEGRFPLSWGRSRRESERGCRSGWELVRPPCERIRDECSPSEGMKKAIRTNKIIVGCFKVFDLKLYIVQPWKKNLFANKEATIYEDSKSQLCSYNSIRNCFKFSLWWLPAVI